MRNQLSRFFESRTRLNRPLLCQVLFKELIDTQQLGDPLALQGTCWTKIFLLGQATLRALAAVFRPVRVFFREPAAVFLALGVALAEDSNSSLGCFEVRWWP